MGCRLCILYCCSCCFWSARFIQLTLEIVYLGERERERNIPPLWCPQKVITLSDYIGPNTNAWLPFPWNCIAKCQFVSFTLHPYFANQGDWYVLPRLQSSVFSLQNPTDFTCILRAWTQANGKCRVDRQTFSAKRVSTASRIKTGSVQKMAEEKNLLKNKTKYRCLNSIRRRVQCSLLI